MESVFASLEKELIHHEDDATRAETKASLFESIEVFDHRVRRHSSLGYQSPNEIERAGSLRTPRLPFVGKSTSIVSTLTSRMG
uniref:IS3 family transposase n=1 Tax=Tautonia marina TaxID=2653855 RepID=UPI0036F2908A